MYKRIATICPVLALALSVGQWAAGPAQGGKPPQGGCGEGEDCKDRECSNSQKRDRPDSCFSLGTNDTAGWTYVAPMRTARMERLTRGLVASRGAVLIGAAPVIS